MLNTLDCLAVTDERAATLSPQHPLMETYLSPTPIPAADRMYLVYELHLTNAGLSDLHLVSVQVCDSVQPERVLMAVAEGLLAGCVVRPGLPQGGDELCVGPNQRAIVLITLPFDDPLQIPNVLVHEVVCTAQGDGLEHALTSRGAFVYVRKKPPLCIGPPVRGGNWYVLNAFDAGKYGHRGVIRAHQRHGGAVDPQRYAIDLFQIDRRGRTYRGAGDRNQDAYCFGREVVAATTGVIAAVLDGVPDNMPGYCPMLADMDTAGNYVILDMLNGHYAFYAHLRNGAMRVREGERVSRGDVLGFVGNSGRSDRPHLHFHVSDSNAFYAESLPYVFKKFELEGQRSFDDLLRGDLYSQLERPLIRRHEMPMEEFVVRF